MTSFWNKRPEPSILPSKPHQSAPMSQYRRTSPLNSILLNGNRVRFALTLVVCGLSVGCQGLNYRGFGNNADAPYDDWAVGAQAALPPTQKVVRPSAYAQRRNLADAPEAEASPQAAPEAAPPAEVTTASAEIPAPSADAASTNETQGASGPVKVSLSDSEPSAAPAAETESSDVVAEEPAVETGNSSVDSQENKESPEGTAQTTSSENEMDIVDVGVDEIDFEGALAELPAPYRELLRRQLAAVKNSEKSLSKPAGDGNETEDSGNGSLDTSSSKVAVKASLSDSGTISSSLNTSDLAESSNVALASSAVHTDTSVDSGVLPASANAPLAKLEGQPATADLPSNLNQSASASIERLSIDGLPLTPSHWNQALSQSISLLEKQIAETPTTDENLRFHHEIALRMLLVAARRLDDACRPIEGMTEQENSYLRYQMQALYEASNPDAMPIRSRHLSLVMNSQREATNHLAAASNLEIRSAAFCTEVERYGVVTKFPKYQFVEDQEVLLYCEIENVAAKQIADGFETQLQGSYEIIDANGQCVSEQILPMEPDVCQNHRRDYFIVYQIYMPQAIQPGNYKLRLTVEDMNARKFGQSTLDFQIKK